MKFAFISIFAMAATFSLGLQARAGQTENEFAPGPGISTSGIPYSYGQTLAEYEHLQREIRTSSGAASRQDPTEGEFAPGPGVDTSAIPYSYGQPAVVAGRYQKVSGDGNTSQAEDTTEASNATGSSAR